MTTKKTYNTVAKFVYGQTADEAIAAGNCLACKEPVNRDDLNDTNLMNYVESAMCPKCWADMVADKDESQCQMS